MGRQGEQRQVGAARRRSRGHGLTRLDGTRPRATVADKVMKSGKMVEQATARSWVSPAGKRQRAGPKRGSRAVGVRDVEGWRIGSPVRDEWIVNLEQRGPGHLGTQRDRKISPILLIIN